MAKSFARQNNPALNDDRIKEAIKTGLTSIQASDELINKTLLRCQNEMAKTNERKAGKVFSFMPLVYRIGAPLAAGALVLVLIFNANSPFRMGKQSAAAPEAASYDAAAFGNGAMSRVAADEESMPAATASAAPAPSVEIQYSEAITSAEQPADGAKTKGFTDNVADQASYKLDALNSSTNRTSNTREAGKTESVDVFRTIVAQYNTSNGTQLDLYEDGITRIQTLINTGVNSEMLKNVKSFRDLLSGEGYWALPLKNASGEIQGLIAVNPVDKQDSGLSVSNLDIIVNVDNKDYLASVYANSNVSALNILFDTNRLNEIVKSNGYQEVSAISAVDINFGQDFMIFVEADGKELGIPLLRDEAVLGLVNNSIYETEALFRIISQHIH